MDALAELLPPSRYGRLRAVYRARSEGEGHGAAQSRASRARVSRESHAKVGRGPDALVGRASDGRGARERHARLGRESAGRAVKGRRRRRASSGVLASGDKGPRSHDTRAALLDHAERLFAMHGFEATSVRAITSAARANLGAVNYHFRSKNGLILEVLRRRIRPLNEQRLAMLQRLESQSAGKPLPIGRILEALFRPPLQLVTEAKQTGQYFVRLIAHCFADSGAFLRPLIEEELGARNREFHAAIRRALPYLSSDDIHWRLHFADGVFLHTIANAHVLEIASGGRCRLGDVNKVLERMIAFCWPGFAAQVKGKRSK